MSESGTGLREIKKQMTRESIADAALQLALEKGLDQVTIEEIAHLAFVSPRTFSNYFSCKEEAVVAAGSKDFQPLIEEFIQGPTSEPLLQSLGALLVAAARATPAEQLQLNMQKMELSRQYPSLRPFQTAQYDSFEQALREAIATRTATSIDTDIYPWLAAASTIAAIKSAVTVWALTGGHPRQLPDLLQDAFTHISAGLPAPTKKSGTARQTV